MRGATKLLGSFLDRGPADGFEVGRDVDAVTGATFSSRGLALAAREAAKAVAERGAARSPGGRAPLRLGAQGSSRPENVDSRPFAGVAWPPTPGRRRAS